MTLYYVSIAVHILAASLWLGHMFVWSLLAGPAMKTIEPAATSDLLRERSLYMGGLGWPALVLLIVTGGYLLHWRGFQAVDFLSGAAFRGSAGRLLLVKLVLVLAMIGYQAIFAHRRAPIAIYMNIVVALVILGVSVVIVRA